MGPHDGAPIPVFPTGEPSCCAANTDGVDTVASSSYPRRFWRCSTASSTAVTTPTAIWWWSTVTVTISYTGVVGISRSGRVLLTKAAPLEEPCARKAACTVLQTSGRGDPLAEFTQDHRAVKRLTRPMLGFKSF